MIYLHWTTADMITYHKCSHFPSPTADSSQGKIPHVQSLYCISDHWLSDIWSSIKEKNNKVKVLKGNHVYSH